MNHYSFRILVVRHIYTRIASPLSPAEIPLADVSMYVLTYAIRAVLINVTVFSGVRNT